MEDLKNQLIDKIRELSSLKGFVTIDEITKITEMAGLSLDEIDKFCEVIVGQGIIINIDIGNNQNEYSYDKSKIDYDLLYEQVIKIDPSLTSYINGLRLIPPPQYREETTIIHQAIEGNEYAKNRIVTMHLKVVVRIALWYYENYSLPLSDTIQEGNLGLLLALKKISPEKQRFSSYAPWWVRQVVHRLTLNLCTIFILPVHVKEMLFKIIDFKNNHNVFCYDCLSDEHCHKLIDDVIENFAIKPEKLELYLTLLEEPISIEDCIEQEIDNLFSDHGNYDSNLISSIYHKELNEALSEMLNQLSQKERQVLSLRHGFPSGKEKTLEEVGQILGLTRERIRQIEARGLRRLRHHSRISILKPFLT